MIKIGATVPPVEQKQPEPKPKKSKKESKK